MSDSREIYVPYPPSANRYYRTVNGRTMISREARKYRRLIAQYAMVYRWARVDGPLALTINVWPPDRRRRDLDNVLKVLLDALEHAGCYENDAQIKSLDVRMQPYSADLPEGRVIVKIEPDGRHE